MLGFASSVTRWIVGLLTAEERQKIFLFAGRKQAS
jgi:hypothetical protein